MKEALAFEPLEKGPPAPENDFNTRISTNREAPLVRNGAYLDIPTLVFLAPVVTNLRNILHAVLPIAVGRHKWMDRCASAS